MKTPENYSSTALSELIDQRIQKKAQGCAPQLDQLNTASSSNQNHVHLANRKKHQSLQQDFLELLFDQKSPVNTTEFKSPKKVTPANELDGTKEFFCSLNKQEKANNSNKPFEMTIQNTAMGELQISGKYQENLLQLSIKNMSALSKQEKLILKTFLQVKLANALNTPLEVFID